MSRRYSTDAAAAVAAALLVLTGVVRAQNPSPGTSSGRATYIDHDTVGAGGNLLSAGDLSGGAGE